VAKKEIAVKKYVVEPSAEERKPLEDVIQAGKSSSCRAKEGATVLIGHRSASGEPSLAFSSSLAQQITRHG